MMMNQPLELVTPYGAGVQQPYPQPPMQQPYYQAGVQPPMQPGFQQQAYGQPALQPVMQQPRQQVQFMPRPEAIAGVPPGLEYLAQINELLIHQQVEIFEIVTGYEGQNKYQIKNTLGQQVYFAAEESDFCSRQCCGNRRGFVLHITDNTGKEVMRVVREFRCCAGYSCCACSMCCAYMIQVEAPPGQILGYAKQLQSFTSPCYSISDAGQQERLYIEGPLCICEGSCCTWNQEFKIESADRKESVGKLVKQWGGFGTQQLNTDVFKATFPQGLDVRLKAILIGTVFLIDFMFFEEGECCKCCKKST